jgi:TonB family protein
MGSRLFFILIFFVLFVEITGAKPPKKKNNLEENGYLFIKMNDSEKQFFSDSVSTVLGFCNIQQDSSVKKEILKDETNPIIPEQNIKDDFTLVIPEIMCSFPGGNDSLRKFLANKIIYPRLALENNISGMVVLKFTISKSGEICNPEIAKSVCRLLDFESLRVLRLMPKWKPASNNGVLIDMNYMLPIKFSIK